jgi:hypothetical protein
LCTESHPYPRAPHSAPSAARSKSVDQSLSYLNLARERAHFRDNVSNILAFRQLNVSHIDAFEKGRCSSAPSLAGTQRVHRPNENP